MFKSITFLHVNDKEDNCTDFIYKLIDTDFECNVVSSEALHTVLVTCILQEYNKRNYSYKEIVKNLFMCNLYLCNKHGYIFDKLLIYQLKYIKDIDFSKLYYEDLKDMWDKHKVFM